MNTSLVSICIPVFNGEKFLQEALDSIEVQTYPYIEVIISDDGSGDSSLAICKKYQKESNFPVYIYKHKSAGIGANWNHCISKSNGEYIKFLFQDDLLLPGCIEEMLEVFEEHDEIRLVGCKRKILSDGSISWQEKWKERYGDLQKGLRGSEEKEIILNSSILKDRNFFKDPYNRIGEPTAVLFEKQLIDEIGNFREDLKIVLDIEFYYRVLTRSRILIVNKELVGFRLHEKQASRLEAEFHFAEFKLYQKILLDEYWRFLSRTHLYYLIKKRLKYFINPRRNKIR
ncbi:glycosyltransferase family 2 protein [Salinimicrobium soli]|uniref:glycosyltransferase family 2 protein n=1 Tax=Salinimicrobium soli TaxID=1254399 RepID=UPI003AAE736F